MIPSISKPLVVLALLCIAACNAPAQQKTSAGVTSLDDVFEQDTLSIVNDDGERHEFDIYLADNADQQRRGLMFVRNMPQTTGMLFVYDDARTRSMWMKNTYIPLDMLFVRADGSVSSVIHDTTPLRLDPQASTEPVTFVLELNAGTARRLNIGNKSRIDWAPPGQ